MNTPELKFFSDPHILRHVGRPLLMEFFEPFTHLLPSKYFLPNPRPDNEHYFDSLAEVLERSSELPDCLAQALREVESLAAAEDPENHSQYSDAAPLSQAIRAWLDAQSTGNGSLSCSSSAVASATEAGEDGRPVLHRLEDGGGEQVSEKLAATEPPETPVTEAPTTEPQSSAPPPSDFPPPPSDQQVFQRLAQLSTTEYDRVRRAEAKRLHLRLATLDAEVARCRSQMTDDAQANAVKFPVIVPWPDPVLDAPELLTEVAARFAHHIILPPGAADAIALFIAHAHAFTAFYQSPRLNLYSPRRGCGKTTTLDVLATMVPRPFRTENMRAPVLFRVVDQQQPTLLLDEVDTYLHQADELRGLLNAGHKRGACAYRCEGAGNAIRAFKAFAPAVLAGIGELPPTLHDRSILVPLVPAEPGQLRARFDEHRTDLEKILARKLARWARDNFNALAACDPLLPANAFNRLADNWRPLFAVAQIVGGNWPQRAADAFAKLTTPPASFSLSWGRGRGEGGSGLVVPSSGGPDSVGLALLADIRLIFAQHGAQRLFSTALVDSLRALQNRPWSGANIGDKPITVARLGRRLGVFGIRSQTIRIGHLRAKGYDLADFAQALARFPAAPQ